MHTAFAESSGPVLQTESVAEIESCCGQDLVLIVDAHESSRSTLARRVRKQGFIALAAGSGAEGLQLARRHRPAAVVVDLCLPDVDGLSLCQELTDGAETCAIPVIGLNRQEQPDMLCRARAAGCHFYLHEPYDPRVLMTLIRQAIDDSVSWNAGGDWY
ncbi:MAG: response regulator [Planctomycetota bacterium]